MEASVHIKGHGRRYTHRSCFPGYPIEASVYNLELADPDYGILAGVEILLEGRFLARQSSMTGGFVPTSIVSIHDVFRPGTKWRGERRESTSTHVCGVALIKDSKGVYKGPVGKTFRWRKKECIKTAMFWPTEYVDARIHELGYFRTY